MKWSARLLFPGQKAKSLAKDVSQMVKATQSWWLGYQFLRCLKEKGNSGELFSLTSCSIMHNQEERRDGETQDINPNWFYTPPVLKPLEKKELLHLLFTLL